jgi:hypothetical protein
VTRLLRQEGQALYHVPMPDSFAYAPYRLAGWLNELHRPTLPWRIADFLSEGGEQEVFFLADTTLTYWNNARDGFLTYRDRAEQHGRSSRIVPLGRFDDVYECTLASRREYYAGFAGEQFDKIVSERIAIADSVGVVYWEVRYSLQATGPGISGHHTTTYRLIDHGR